jgi:uncharacterized repeat protein (TIGR01451 family)
MLNHHALSATVCAVTIAALITACSSNKRESRPEPVVTGASEPQQATTTMTSPSNRTTTTQPSTSTTSSTSGTSQTRTTPTSSSLALPTGDPATSTLLLSQTMPSQLRANTPYAYDIHVKNLTRNTLSGVVVNEMASANHNIQSSSPSATKGEGGGSQWAIGELGPGAEQVIHITAMAPKAGTPASSCLSAEFNSALCTSVPVVEPALALTKVMTPQSVLNCGSITSTITVKNVGTGDATNVVIHESLPAGLTSDGKTQVDIPVGTLAQGQSKPITLNLKANKTGKFENTATATADGNLTAKSEAVTTTVGQPVLEITCKASDRVFPGGTATFEATVKNTGDAPCDPTVTVSTGGNARIARAEGVTTTDAGGATFRVGQLAPGQAKTVTVGAQTGDALGVVNFSVGASAECTAAVQSSCRTNVMGIPALMLNGYDDPDPVQIGQTTTYTLKLTNQGSAPLTNITLVCTMDDNMQYVSDTGPTRSAVAGKTITFAPIDTLAPKDTRTYQIVIRATGEAQVQLHAEAKSNEITLPLVKAETTNFYK